MLVIQVAVLLWLGYQWVRLEKSDMINQSVGGTHVKTESKIAKSEF